MNVTLTRRGHRWQLRWTDPATGKRIRRTIPANTRREAERIRDAKHSELLALTYPSTSSTPSIAIAQALQEAIANTTANDATQANYRHQAGQIAAWFVETYPKIEHWRQVTLEMLRRYADHCQETCAPATTRLRAYLLRAASHHMAAVYNQPDTAALWRVRIRRNPMEDQTNNTRKLLTAGQMNTLIDWLLEGHKHDAAAVCALCGLAGLRVSEALALSLDDIDATASEITVRDKPWHQVKNRQSRRTIPTSDKATTLALFEPYHDPDARVYFATNAWLKHHGKTRRPFSEFVSAPIFKTANENVWRVDAWSRKMRELFDRLAKESDDPHFRGYQPRWLRASFASAVRSRGVDERLVKRYLGHSLGDTLGDHYEVTRPHDLRPVVEAIDEWFAGKTVEGDQECRI